MKTISLIPRLPDPLTDPSEFARQLGNALSKVGAAYIPVSQFIDSQDLLRNLQSFFALSEVEKRSLAKQLTSPWQGVFIALGEEQLASGQEDYKEVLDINLENGTYAQWIRQRQHSHNLANRCVALDESLIDSEKLSRIAQSLCQISRAFQGQANRVLAALEMVYQQPTGSLVSQHGNNSTLRLLHYPLAPHLTLGAIRLGAHQDYSGITLLWQDSTGGLEILTRDREWVAVDIPSGYIGVIASEVMQRWSGETLHGAPHRVRITNVQQIHQSRYSIAFFCETNSDCVVYPGSLLTGADQKANEPIVINTFLSQKYDQILANLSLG